MVKNIIILVMLAILANVNASVAQEQSYSPQQMKADLAIIKSAWGNIHPGLYRYNSPQQIEQYFSELDALTNAPLAQRKFFVLLSQLNAKLHCGHSFVSYYNNPKALKTQLYSTVYLPVLFRILDGKMVITHNLSDNPLLKPGVEIRSINGFPVKTILDSLLTVSKADGLKALNKKLDNINIYPRDVNPSQYCLFDIYFPLFFKPDLNDPNYTLVLKSTKGKKATVRCVGLSKEKRKALFVEKYGNLPEKEQTWFLKEIDQKTIVFRLGDFTTYNWKFDFNRYLDSIFTSINQAGYQNLIVDIRQNEGGSDDARDAVLSYLTSKPIGCANPVRRLYRYTSIPDSLLPYLDTWDDGFKQPKVGYEKTPEGYYENTKANGACTNILPKPNHFKGNIFLITDATNSSATFIMAAAFKRNRLGTLVGEKTGGTQQGINGGEIFFFRLPNTGIEMDLPLIYQAPSQPMPDEGILPDHEVKTTMTDIANERDPQMDFILGKLVK